jgi:hypothetical protein
MTIDLIVNSILYLILIFWCTFSSADLHPSENYYQNHQNPAFFIKATHNGYGQSMDFCNQNGPIGPLYGDKNQQVQGIRSQIDYARSTVDNDRASSEQYRHSQDNWQNEQIRLGFEHRRECFEHWRENMERLRSEIESRPYATY